MGAPILAGRAACARYTSRGHTTASIFQASLSCQENKRSGCKQFTPCQITYLTKHSHFKLHCIKSPNARLQLEWPLALFPSNWHAYFHESHPGIIPGSEDEGAWLHFIPKELGAHIIPWLWMGHLGQCIFIQRSPPLPLQVCYSAQILALCVFLCLVLLYKPQNRWSPLRTFSAFQQFAGMLKQARGS